MKSVGSAPVSVLATVLILWALLLHGNFLASAGALWRDEATSVNQANAESWSEVWASIGYDSFPALYPAMLRAFLRSTAPFDDRSVRLFGVAVGLALLSSVWVAGRLVGSRFPVVALALAAADPVFVSEGDSVRPYGISMLCLVWAYCLYARLLLNPSGIRVAATSLACVLAVQASYGNAIFVAALGLCACAAMGVRGGSRQIWKALAPGFVAALSLVPYAGALRQARSWASILHYRVDWREYLHNYTADHSYAPAVAWSLLTSLGIIGLVLLYIRGSRESAPPRLVVCYSAAAASAGIAAQVIFTEAMGVPPFPRYFLPALLLAAFALDQLTLNVRRVFRVAAVLVAVSITARPAWSWVRMARSDVDTVARDLSEQARPSDLVVVSPWFLHPGFQLYYRGSAPWVTVPELPRQPLTRYDLVMDAMADPDREGKLSRRILQTAARGGAVWFVSQSYPERPLEAAMPDSPVQPARPTGSDYVKFRSYWERAIVRRLYDCCTPVEWPLTRRGPVWKEENLVLTRWLGQHGQPR